MAKGRSSSFRLSIDARQIILRYAGKYTALKISRILAEDHGIVTSRQTVWGFIKRYRETKNLSNTRRKRVTRRVNDFLMEVVDMWLEGNRGEMTAKAVADKLQTTLGVHISRSLASLVRKRLGWKGGEKGYCQLISHVNREKRFQFAVRMLSLKEIFYNVVFTDETTVEMNSNGKIHFYKSTSNISELPAKRQKPKHAYKVHVWGGISYRGRTHVCIFTGIMDSIIYQQILENNFLPFVRNSFPDGYRQYQDNDSKHVSKSTKAWMTENGMIDSVMETPASSPDLNPIENVWSALKTHLQNIVKPQRKDDLIKGIADFWTSMSANDCARYIDHVHRVLPAVVLNLGHPTRY